MEDTFVKWCACLLLPSSVLENEAVHHAKRADSIVRCGGGGSSLIGHWDMEGVINIRFIGFRER